VYSLHVLYVKVPVQDSEQHPQYVFDTQHRVAGTESHTTIDTGDTGPHNVRKMETFRKKRIDKWRNENLSVVSHRNPSKVNRQWKGGVCRHKKITSEPESK
jgi:hypothetical protein